MWQQRTMVGLIVALSALPAGAAAAPAEAPDGAQASAAVERSTAIVSAAQRDAELETVFPDDEVVWLGEGEAKTLGVFRASIRDQTRGVIVIVQGPASTADAHTTAAALRQALPRAGWATLTIALPEDRAPAVPPRAVSPAPAAGADPAVVAPAAVAAAVAVDPRPAQIRARLNAAVEVARSRSKVVVVLGEDAVTAWLAWAQLQGLGADALVAINAPTEVPRIEGLRPKSSLAQLVTPALLLMEVPHEWSRDDRLSPTVELQRLSPSAPGAGYLERKILGWLKRHYPSA
jgi:hypothetical protein